MDNLESLESEIENILNLGPEDDNGTIEYKRMLTDKSPDRIEELATQMRYRMSESKWGECLYILGLDDDGSPYGLTEDEYKESYDNLLKVADINDYSLRLLNSTKHKNKKIYEFLVRENNIIKCKDIRIAVTGNVDSSKCLKFDSKVIMSNGNVKKIQDVNIGDLLMSDDSTERKVLSTTNGITQMYKITPVNGDPITITKNHILCFKASNYNYVYYDKSRERYGIRHLKYKNKIPMVGTTFFPIYRKSRKSHKKDMKIYDTKEAAYDAANLTLKNSIVNGVFITYKDIIELTFEQYINLNKSTHSALKLYRIPVSYSEKHVDIDPWLLGYWLGDGDSCGAGFTTADEVVIENIINIISQYDNLILVQRDEYHYYIRSITGKFYANAFLNFLKESLLINNKHIPSCYKYNSREIRLQVLAGIIDADGTLEHKSTGYAFSMSLKYENLIDDIIEISRSLGFACYITYTTAICTNGANGPVECPIASFTIYGEGIEDIPVILERKKSKPRESPKDVLMTGVKNIEVIENQEYYGFELDGNGRFLLDDFTVTHNSTTVGVLISGELDNGNGKARSKVLHFKHEIESGRTSSLSQQIVGYDPDGNVVNHENKIKQLSWPEIAKKSSKIVIFSDLAGHTKYAKVTIKGLSSHAVDYALVMIAANKGLNRKDNTLEHIRLCLTYKVPMIVVLSKIDLCQDKEALNKTIEKLKQIFRSPGSRKTIYKINDMSDVIKASEFVEYGSQVPLFMISNTSGAGITLLHEFFNILNPRVEFDSNKPVELYVDSTYMVEGVGTIVGGFLASGILKVGEKYKIGPDHLGQYKEIKVRSLHVKRTLVNEAMPGRYVCANLPKFRRKDAHPGMVILECQNDKYANKVMSIKRFEANIVVRESHHTSIKVGYQASMVIGALRTTVRLCHINHIERVNLRCSKDKQQLPIVDIDENGKEKPAETILRQGNRATVEIQLLYRPGYFNIDDRIVLSEGNVKIVGMVTKILD